ncbi:MAG: asparagine synthase (glutamine-hydrolyzing) [Desulfobacteraceae bacterium]|jgi:asparagine synthase (glutamine-hydrolysing)|nr:asparagine synthase (glutamine-hydrolyzing) [Desulfobacteraceae bacterium]
MEAGWRASVLRGRRKMQRGEPNTVCGICGINEGNESLVSRMCDQMAHRGPDQDGIFSAEGITLGHRRLSIIDLSENGRQPMFNEDGSLVLICNGEIYNFQALRKELQSKGHRFSSLSDSEVILHGYEQWGLDAVSRFRGMFAFALYDTRRRRLWLVRDRIGIKPLYYYHHDGKLVFASEIKAILEDRRIVRELNHQALYDYLGFEFVPAPQTMFRHIYKLPAGHHLVLEDGRATVAPYWDLSFQPAKPKPSYSEAVEQQLHLIDTAVHSHLVSDVPLGVLLSGGLDSSTLVAMMRRHISGSLKTFTIGYEDKTFSELDYAQQVAEHFETDHHVLMLDTLKPQYVEKSLWHLDEPMTDLSAVPLYLLCQQVRDHVTVCLSGEGADESYAGYDRFKASSIERFFRLLPRPMRKDVIGRLVDRLPDQPQKKGAINLLKRFVQGALLPEEGAHLRWQYFNSLHQDERLFDNGFRRRARLEHFRPMAPYRERCDATDRINREIYLDIRFMMADSVLMKVDKMSMASSLEMRVPFLDHVLVEYLASLPGHWKLHHLTTKYIFRSALEGILPDNIVHRGKQGYSLPVKHLLREDLKTYMVELLNDARVIRENMSQNYVNQLIDEHCRMSHNHNHILWALMNVAIWHNRFFE